MADQPEEKLNPATVMQEIVKKNNRIGNAHVPCQKYKLNNVRALELKERVGNEDELFGRNNILTIEDRYHVRVFRVEKQPEGETISVLHKDFNVGYKGESGTVLAAFKLFEANVDKDRTYEVHLDKPVYYLFEEAETRKEYLVKTYDTLATLLLEPPGGKASDETVRAQIEGFFDEGETHVASFRSFAATLEK